MHHSLVADRLAAYWNLSAGLGPPSTSKVAAALDMKLRQPPPPPRQALLDALLQALAAVALRAVAAVSGDRPLLRRSPAVRLHITMIAYLVITGKAAQQHLVLSEGNSGLTTYCRKCCAALREKGRGIGAYKRCQTIALSAEFWQQGSTGPGHAGDIMHGRICTWMRDSLAESSRLMRVPKASSGLPSGSMLLVGRASYAGTKKRYVTVVIRNTARATAYSGYRVYNRSRPQADLFWHKPQIAGESNTDVAWAAVLMCSATASE